MPEQQVRKASHCGFKRRDHSVIACLRHRPATRGRQSDKYSPKFLKTYVFVRSSNKLHHFAHPRQYQLVASLSCHVYMLLIFAHIPFLVNRAFQRNASGVVATTRCCACRNGCLQHQFVSTLFVCNFYFKGNPQCYYCVNCFCQLSGVELS